MSTTYTCDKCNYTTKVKSSFIAHTTKRKVPCDAGKSGAAAPAALQPEETVEVKADVPVEAKPETKSEAKPEVAAPKLDAKSEPEQKQPIAEKQPTSSIADPRTRQFVINCVKVETVNRLHDTIYLVEECIKRPDPDPKIQTGKQYKTLADLIQVYHELVYSLKHREAAIAQINAGVPA